MEKEGFMRSLAALKPKVKIQHVVTDRHKGIAAYMRQEEPEIKHFYDCWHVVKGTSYSLITLEIFLFLCAQKIDYIDEFFLKS